MAGVGVLAGRDGRGGGGGRDRLRRRRLRDHRLLVRHLLGLDRRRRLLRLGLDLRLHLMLHLLLLLLLPLLLQISCKSLQIT